MLEEKREIESHHVRCLKTRSTPTIEKLEIVLGVEASQESTPTPLPSRQHLDSSTSTYLRLTHQQLDKSTSTYFRLIINVFISRRRLILHSDECSTTKVPGCALDSTYFDLSDSSIGLRSTYQSWTIDRCQRKAKKDFQHFNRGGGSYVRREER